MKKKKYNEVNARLIYGQILLSIEQISALCNEGIQSICSTKKFVFTYLNKNSDLT